MNASLPIDLVFMRKDARKIDEAAISRLITSIEEVGLINPIRVRETVRPDHPQAWEVIAGGHRLRAMRKLGFEEIPAVVVEDDDLHAELAMIDENLMRAELTAADRAQQTARRKAIYLELHPETAAGAFKGNRHTGSLAAENISVTSFAAATAAATGKDQRTVRLDAERGEKITDEALALVVGTVIDKGTELDKLKKIAPDKQVAWVQKRLAESENAKAPGKRKQPKKDAVAVVAPAETTGAAIDDFMDLWNAANDEERRSIHEITRAYAEEAGWN